MTRQESLDRVCTYRQLPPLKVGAECEIDGRRGIIDAQKLNIEHLVLPADDF